MKKIFLFPILAIIAALSVFGISGCGAKDDLTVETAAVETSNRRLGNIPFRDTMQSVYSKEEIDALIEQIYEDFNSSLDPTAVRTNTVELVTQKVVMRTNIVEKVLETYEVNNITNQYTDYHYDVTHTTNNIYEYYNVYKTNNITTLIDTTNLVTELHVVTNEYVNITTNRYYPLELNWTTNDFNPDYPPFDWDEYDLGPLIVVSSNLVDNDLVQIAANAFSGHDNITGVFCTNVTTVGANAFKNCENLMVVDLPNATSIADGAFSGCSNLVAVNLPRITSVSQNMFENCVDLKIVNIPSVDTIREQAFKGALNEVGMDTFNAPALTRIRDEAFWGSGLVNFSHEGVTNLYYSGKGGQFKDCYSLTNLYLPNVANTFMYTCLNCTNLQTVYLPKAITILNECFKNCYSIEYICITNANHISGYSFVNCGMKDIYINAHALDTEIFQNCNNLTNIVFHSNSTINSADVIGSSTSLETIQISISNLLQKSGAGSAAQFLFKPKFGRNYFPNLKYIFVLEHPVSDVQQIYGKWSIESGSGVQIFCSDGKIVL